MILSTSFSVPVGPTSERGCQQIVRRLLPKTCTSPSAPMPERVACAPPHVANQALSRTPDRQAAVPLDGRCCRRVSRRVPRTRHGIAERVYPTSRSRTVCREPAQHIKLMCDGNRLARKRDART